MPRLVDQVRFTRPRAIPGLELVAAEYRNRRFPRHIHDDYVVGVMTGGAESLVTDGTERFAHRGDLILLEPGKAHANASVGDLTLAYRVFYIPEPLMAAATGRYVRFRRAVAPGAGMGQRLARIHAILATSATGSEQETALYATLAELADTEGTERAQFRKAHRQVRAARDFLNSCYRDDVSLRHLAALVSLSPYHLLRCFAVETGLTPGAYQTQLRIREARRLLREGTSIADVAAAVGFADQSHLTRHFQRIVGTSPGRYSQQ